MDKTYSNYAGHSASNAMQNSATIPQPPTAAQDTLSATERLVINARELSQLVVQLAERLAAHSPQEVKANAPTPNRSGIIGSIHSTVEQAEEIILECVNTMSAISRKI